MERKRKDDKMIEEIQTDVKAILKILNGNGELGLVAKTINNEKAIKELQARPTNVKNWVIAIAIIINMAVGIGALVIKL